jgi:beta-glucosidase
MLVTQQLHPIAIVLTLLTASCNTDTNTQTDDADVTTTMGKAATVNPPGSLIDPQSWPHQSAVMVRDADMEQRISELMTRMTLEEKVGQIMQADIASVTPEQVREFNLGSILNGGGSAPGMNLRNTPESWLTLADEFWEASTDTSDGGVGIPTIWGTDAMHGSSNIVGATLFPHNIGLGAANDPDLVYEIGRITALETRVTGFDWTFAPTVAVVRNDRWGRTYEGFSEDPQIVVSYAPRFIEGLQGKYGTDEFLDEDHTIATAKHYTGDGGTFDGNDQGDNLTTQAELRDIHSAGYPVAIAAGAQTVMASYNSFHGRKLHGVKSMLTNVLVGQMGFDGFVVGDWNGHGQVKGCSNDSCPASFNAGLDMFMVPKDWEALYFNTLEQVRNGQITLERLDQAVARILRVKMRAGVLDAPRPSSRKHAGDWALLGAPEHRAISREAVRKSLVLLKNENAILPLASNSKVLVAGDGANNIGKQTGGWTLSWQGTGNDNEHFPNATSIFDGIREVVEAAGGRAFLGEKGQWKEKPDVAIIVFGEDPYAEGLGDRPNVDYARDDGLELLRKFKQAGIPTVSVFISGRALWVNPELNLSDAFVAAWLPGSEGGGIADMMFADAQGQPRYNFTGRLSYSWPATAGQVEVNVGDDNYEPLFAYGYGLGFGDSTSVPALSEDPGISGISDESTSQFIVLGDPVGYWRIKLMDDSGVMPISDVRGQSVSGRLQIVPADHKIQEDTFIATWTGPASLVIEGEPADFQRQVSENQVLELSYQVLQAETSSATIAIGEGVLELAEQFVLKSAAGWQTSHISISCFVNKGAQLDAVTEPLVITADGSLKLQVASARLLEDPGNADCNL